MKFVGIRNSPQKQRLLAEGTPGHERMDTGDVAFDCIRHLDFLHRAVASGAPARDTLYWRYLIRAGHTPAGADERCRRFAGLASAVLDDSLEQGLGSVAVTEDGVRLDGSHRAAIAHWLGLEELDVRVYRWSEVLSRWRILAALEEAAVKRSAQEAHLGRAAYDRRTGERLGTVAFVEAQVPRWPLLALGAHGTPILVIERPDGALESRELESLSLR
jgi:hypothetical protein